MYTKEARLLVYATVIKTAVWILIIVELWLLLQVPAVGDAIFSFIVGGEVPGTSKILTLNEMILFLTGLFVLTVALLFHGEINRLVGGMRPQQKQIPAQIVAKTTKPQASKQKQAKVRRVTRWRSVVSPYVRMATAVLTDIKTIGTYWLGIGLVRAQKAIEYGAVTGARYAQKGWAVAFMQAKSFWKWLRPRIEHFDRWLDHVLHQNDKTASVLSFGNEMAKTVKAWVAYVRTLKDKYLRLK